MQLNSKDWVIVGRFGRPHGVKGLITVHSYTQPSDNILTYLPWHVLVNNQWQPLVLNRSEVRHKLIVAEVEGYNDREQVAMLTNYDIAVESHVLPKLGTNDYYWYQLIGMQVKNTQDKILGVVKEIMPTGAHDVLVVEGEKRTLIPYVRDRFIIQIEHEKNLITVDWELED